MSEDDFDLFAEFGDDTPDPAMSSAKVAALDAVVAYTEQRQWGLQNRTADPDDYDGPTYHGVLGTWLREHKDSPVPLILALLERAGESAMVDRMVAVPEQTWLDNMQGERDLLEAEHVGVQAAYAAEGWDDEEDDLDARS